MRENKSLQWEQEIEKTPEIKKEENFVEDQTNELMEQNKQISPSYQNLKTKEGLVEQNKKLIRPAIQKSKYRERKTKRAKAGKVHVRKMRDIKSDDNKMEKQEFFCDECTYSTKNHEDDHL